MITLFLSFSPEEWDGPRSLAEMVEAEDEAVLSRMPDYRINLVSPAEIQAQEFEKFHSSLGNVLEFIKYSSDQKKLMGWLFREKPGIGSGAQGSRCVKRLRQRRSGDETRRGGSGSVQSD